MSVVISPFSFLILWVLSVFLMSLVKGLSILKQRTSSLFPCFFIFIFCILKKFLCHYFCSNLYYFLPSTLGFIFSFPSSFRFSVRLICFSASWGRPIVLWIFLSGLILMCFVDFVLLCVHFHFFQGNFWFLPWAHCCPIHYLVTCYLDPMCFCIFYCNWFLISYQCGQRRCLIWFQSSWIY